MSQKLSKKCFSAPTKSRTIKEPTLPIEKNTNDWNPMVELAIKQIGEKSTGYKIMHVRTSRKTERFYDLVMYLGICLGPLAGLLSGIGSTLNPDAPITFPIISSCVSFLSGIIVAVIKFGKYEEKSSAHKLAASKYTSLESNVRRQLAKNRSDRINMSQYFEWIGQSFDDLFLASPLISEKIYQDYVNSAKKNNISIPDEYGLNITINKEYENEKLEELINTSEIVINNDDEKYIKPKVKSLENGKNDVVVDISEKHFRNNIYKEDSKSIKRTNTISHFPELDKFGDGRMKYEMKRLMGF